LNQIITPWQAIILGLAQGLTEFIPVSSSAHLNILHWIFGQDRKLAYDVMLHVGTLCALAFYFRHDWVALLRDRRQAKLRNLIFIACIPAVVAGVLLRKLEDKPPLSEVWFNAVMLVIMGAVLWWADHTGRKRRQLEGVNLKDALIIGCSQALALVPGVSRSGATITAGLFREMTREAAARFSFLLSLPITVGAVGFEFLGMVKKGELSSLNASPAVLMLGILVSAASGFWAIGFLLNFLKKHDVTLFFLWRVAVAVAVFALIATGFRR
jgi:undecaprenyl-diphosphatase